MNEQPYIDSDGNVYESYEAYCNSPDLDLHTIMLKLHNGIRKRQNDVYVFCLNLGDSFESSDPFEMSHWEFYVVPTSTINKECGHQGLISLGRLRAITPEWGSVPYKGLRDAIDKALR